MRFVDSHLHFGGFLGGDEVRDASCLDMLLFCCGVDKATSEETLRAAAQHPGQVRAFVGTHPSESEREPDLRWLATCLKAASGLGEIGLDPKYSGIGPGSAQRNVFIRQLEASRGEGKPVQVHSRGAELECLEILENIGPETILMHWFQDETLLSKLVGRGYYISFGPALINSRKLQRMAAKCDPRSVVVESDSPVSYHPLGGVHGPCLIPSVVFKLAELWGRTFEETRILTAENALRYLGTAGKG
ncbi:MAG TPA: TatD family hydrolase [Nitrososphaerales archaeon]|nr:TatD family hydrolase [Nitrososphaerales archaeon]